MKLKPTSSDRTLTPVKQDEKPLSILDSIKQGGIKLKSAAERTLVPVESTPMPLSPLEQLKMKLAQRNISKDEPKDDDEEEDEWKEYFRYFNRYNRYFNVNGY